MKKATIKIDPVNGFYIADENNKPIEFYGGYFYNTYHIAEIWAKRWGYTLADDIPLEALNLDDLDK